jgi:hypothetical protein
VLALSAVLALAGCSSAPTVGDGSLGVDWAVLPSPSVPVPLVGVCSAGSAGQQVAWHLPFLGTPTVACTDPHLSETYHVGTFPADVDTDPNTVPSPGTARFRFAYTTCSEQTAAYLGRGFQTSRLAMVPVMPTERQWAGQARWFRCELMEIAGLDRTIVERTASLRGALQPGGPLATTCAATTLNPTRTVVLTVAFTSCDAEHDVELTGAYAAPDGDYPGRQALAQLSTDGCQSAGASYVGVSTSVLLTPGSAAFTFATEITEEMWSVGERTASCFYGSLSERRTGSVQDLGVFPY